MRFLRECGVTHPLLIVDSSDRETAEAIRAQCSGAADYSFCDPTVDVAQKYLHAAEAVATPFMVMLPDDDVTFPHAIDASLVHLAEHADYVAAHGYVLRFGMHGDHVDVHSVFSYTPTIDAERPLYRHYELMRRYQPFTWAVFRTEIFALAVAGAAATQGTVFQELAFMSLLSSQGRLADKESHGEGAEHDGKRPIQRSVQHKILQFGVCDAKHQAEHGQAPWTLPVGARALLNAPPEAKKPTWRNTRWHFTTSAYSSTGPRHCPVALHLVIRRLQGTQRYSGFSKSLAIL